MPTTPTFWVDVNTGTDTNPGTQAAPVRTINKALLLAASGGTIVVALGNYGETLDISSTVPLLLLSEERYAARFQRLNCSGCSDLTVEGFEIAGATLPLVSINGGSRVAVRDNVVYFGSSAGIRVTSDAKDVDIVSNVLYDTNSAHIHVNAASNVRIRDNVVFYNSGPSNGSARIWLEAASDTLIAGNVIFRSLGDDFSYGMISLRDTTGTTLVENNVIAGSPGATNVYASIGFDMATGSAKIRHNTFVGPLPGSAFGLGAGAVMSGSNFTLVNNLWMSAGTAQPFTDGNAPAGTVTLRHNLYWNAPGGQFAAGGSPTPASDTEAIVADPALTSVLPSPPIRSGTGFAGGATTTCEVHTQVVDALARIGTTSMAVGQADPTESPSVDVRGHARPSAPAVGAYEP
jgi:hypothetical protein